MMPPITRQNGAMQRTHPLLLGLVAGLVLGACAADGPVETPAEEPTPIPTPAETINPDLLDRPWTILFAGTDLNRAREQRGEPVSTDALMLVRLSADQSTLILVSVPRDTVDVPMSGGGTWERKINALYRERGMDALVDAVSQLLDVPIDAYVALDMDDFTRLVGAVGTIEVSPDEPIVDPIVDLDLEAGTQEINDVDANGYVRTRIDQDYGRMGRQQEVLLALVDRLLDPETDLNLRVLLDGLDSLETDLPLDELPTLIELAQRARGAEVRRLVIEPPLITFEGDRGDGRGYVLEADVEAIQDEVRELIGG
jgi:polyisoprenyl-teichoic acid--peptidoglycan teichoic acid transferase